jgi:transposase
MVQAISNDLRKRIVKAVEGGLSRNKASKRFDVAVSTVVNLMNHVKETGSIAPKKIGGYCKPKLLAHESDVRALVTATPDATLA